MRRSAAEIAEMSRAAAAASKIEMDVLRSRNTQLASALGLDSALAAPGPLRVDPSVFIESGWANDMLTSNVLHRENERRLREVAEERACGEARLASVIEEISAAEGDLNALIGRRRTAGSLVFDAASAFKQRVGASPEHEAEWSLARWLEGVLQPELPRLLAEIPFEAMLAGASSTLRDSPEGRRAFLWALGSNTSNRAALVGALRRGGMASLLDSIGDVLWRAVEQFSSEMQVLVEGREARAANARHVHQEDVPPHRAEAKVRFTDDQSEGVDDPDAAPVEERTVQPAVAAFTSGSMAAPKMNGAMLAALSDLSSSKLRQRRSSNLRATNRSTDVLQRDVLDDIYPLSVLSGPPPANPQLRDPHSIFMPLAEIVGSWDGRNAVEAMELEHLRRADSRDEFASFCGGFNVHTSCELEWLLVRDPDRALAVVGIDEWPLGDRTPLDLGFRLVLSPESSVFMERLDEVNAALHRVGDNSGFDMALLIACRMFTGPVGLKYFHVLRRAHSTIPSPTETDLCRGNQYPTTLHHVCLGVGKLSQLTRATPVYCAPAWSPLPASFFAPAQRDHINGDGSRAAVQLGGALEMTTDKAKAKSLASNSGSVLIFEVRQSSTQRGADLEWLTQTPGEPGDETVTFTPLAAFDVVGTRYEGAYTIVELCPTARSLMGTEFHAESMTKLHSAASMAASSGGKESNRLDWLGLATPFGN